MKNVKYVFWNTAKMPKTKRVATCVTSSWFLCLFFTGCSSKFQALCSVLNLFGFDFPLIVGTEDQLPAEPVWLQCLGKGNGISNAGPEALRAPAAVGHCSTLLKSAALEMAFFGFLKHPPAFHQAVILPSATLPDSRVWNQLYREQKN